MPVKCIWKMARKQRLPAVWLAILLPAATALSSAGGMNYQFLVFESQVRTIYKVTSNPKGKT